MWFLTFLICCSLSLPDTTGLSGRWKKQFVYDQDIDAIDLKLEVSWSKEDLYYSTFPSLVKNIRRGNTFLKVYEYKWKKPNNSLDAKGWWSSLTYDYPSSPSKSYLTNYGCDLHQQKNYILGPVLKAIFAQGGFEDSQSQWRKHAGLMVRRDWELGGCIQEWCFAGPRWRRYCLLQVRRRLWTLCFCSGDGLRMVWCMINKISKDL